MEVAMAAVGEDVIQLITSLKDILSPPERKQDNLMETLTVLKELGVIGQQEKQKGDLEKFKMMRDALGLKYAHEVEGEESDPLEMVEGVKTLIDALRPWVKATSPSTRELVLEAFSKHGGPLFETIRNLGRMKKLEVQNRMNDSR